MVASLDDSVGVVVSALKETGQLDNTLLVFSSDNGCAGYIQVCSNAPFKGFKRHHNEGGIRVPLIFSWPDRITAGNYPHMVSLLDLMATFGGLAGSTYTTEDSVDLMPYLIDQHATTSQISILALESNASYPRPTLEAIGIRQKPIRGIRIRRRPPDLATCRGLAPTSS